MNEDPEHGFVEFMRDSWAFSFGELGDIENFGLIRYLVFAAFTFIIPLTLMNLLIAIMGDAYNRVQENSKAADARALANMELEMEQLVYFFKSLY